MKEFVGGEEQSAKQESNGNPSTSKKENEVFNKQDESKDISEEKDEEPVQEMEVTHPTIILRSHKMKELKDLLLSEKLNTQAISLHLTAQSQVQVNKKGRNDLDNVRPKRARRE